MLYIDGYLCSQFIEREREGGARDETGIFFGNLFAALTDSQVAKEKRLKSSTHIWYINCMLFVCVSGCVL